MCVFLASLPGSAGPGKAEGRDPRVSLLRGSLHEVLWLVVGAIAHLGCPFGVQPPYSLP
jgi:hypothetical protein